MSDTLLGVIIGGIIASIIPIITLIIHNRRWRYQIKLERLKEERQRLENKYGETLKNFAKGTTENNYPIDMISDVAILMPPNLFEDFENWIKEKDKTEEKAKFVIMNMSIAMKKHLASIDYQIENLITVGTRAQSIAKILKISLSILLIILIGICGVLLNNYLSDNNLLLYATGTKAKAFLNSTWKMSPKEIERVNNTFLSETTNPFSFLSVPEITNKKRFKELVREDLSLWGENAKVGYKFFDNMLYEYYVSLTTYNLEKTNKEIFQTLRTKFGTGKEIKGKREDLIYYFEWESDKQKVSYWIGKNKEKNSYYVGIRAVYQPFYRQIEELEKKEKQEYF